MKRRFRTFAFLAPFLATALFRSAPARALDEVLCQCAAVSCAACEVEAGLQFYASKCGPDLALFKSCKKISCSPVPDQARCLAALGPPAGARLPASAAASARIVALEGLARVTRGETTVEVARLGLELRVGDTVETLGAGRVKLAFVDGNESVVGPGTRLTLVAHRFAPASDAKRTVLLLHRGGVRNSIIGVYDGRVHDGERNEYLVRTPAAVAGVHGTDFLTSFDPSEKDWKVAVQTFTGRVRLEGLEEYATGSERADVTAGHESLFIAEGAGLAGASFTERNAAIARGHVRSPWSIPADSLQALDRQWSMADAPVVDVASNAAPSGSGKSSRAPASSAVCVAPEADFNQCAWTCENNPPKQSSCRTDLANVQCVRRICLANGAWSDATRTPANQGDSCGAGPAVVRRCDY